MIDRFEAFVSGITICYKYVQRIKSAEMTEFGLKGTHVMVLFHLNRHGEGLTATQLCTLCAEDKAAISRTLADLVEKGYVCSPDDTGKRKYRALVQLTPAGEAVSEQIIALISQWVGTGGDGLTEQQRDTFYYALGVIANNLREEFPNKK